MFDVKYKLIVLNCENCNFFISVRDNILAVAEFEKQKRLWFQQFFIPTCCFR